MEAYRAHCKLVADARRAAEKADHLVTKQAPPPKRYHVKWLDHAQTILQLSGVYITNPRLPLSQQSLFAADDDWMSDFANHQHNIQFFVDYPKRPKGMQ